MAKRQAVVDRMGREVAPWTSKQFELFRRVVARTRPGIPLTHDLSDEDEFEFVLLQHGGRATLKKHYPATLHHLELGRKIAGSRRNDGIDPRLQDTTLLQLADVVNQWSSANVVYQSTAVANGSTAVVADGLSTIIDGTYITQMALTLTDLSTGTMIAQEKIPEVYDRGLYVGLGASGNLTKAGNTGLATLTVSYIPAGSTQMISQTIPSEVNAICPVQPPSVTAPVHIRTKAPNPIKVALNRTSAQQPDCDYYYTTTQTGRTPDVAVQVQGSATFQNNVCGPLTGTSLGGQLLLVRRVNPGGAAIALPADQFQKGITPTGKSLGWSWGANNQFGAAPWDQGQLIDLILNMYVPVSNNCTAGMTPNANVNVSSAKDTQPSNCTAKIDALLFVWGCLASEALVLMANGSRKPAILVEPGEHVVRDAAGRIAVVTDKILGWEDRADSMRIEAGGLTIVVTQDHPMLTPKGAVRAGELLIGSEVRTRRGVVRVDDISFFRYRNRVVNLELQPLEDLREGETPCGVPGTTLIANDFLVGDAVMQGALRRAMADREQDDEAVLRDIPRELHFDYVNLQRARRGEKLMTA
jgi:hypothetical protein